MTAALTNKEIILHVGLPKTASTFLQKRIFPRLDKEVVCYNPGPVMAQLVQSKKRSYDQASLQDLQRCLAEELPKIPQPKVLISYEQICGNPWNNFALFREMTDFLHGLFPEAKIILVLRAQTDWLHSLYRETIFMQRPIWPWQFFSLSSGPGLRRSFPALDIRHYDFAAMHAYYLERFGSDRVQLLFFEELQQDPQSFVTKALQPLGLQASPETRRTVERRGLSAFSIVLLLLAMMTPSYLLERRLKTYAFGDQRFAALLRSSSLAEIVLCALQRGCRKFNAFLALQRRLKSFPDRVFYLDWNLMGRRRRTKLMRHYADSNRALLPYMPNDTVRRQYLEL